MARENFNDLMGFVIVAREGSFTRAAAQLGLSQSALSHTVRGLEARLGIRLLTRTTRSVSATDAGERLYQSLRGRFEEIDAELAALSSARGVPAGTVRITTGENALATILWPKLAPVLRQYPQVHLEFDVSYGLKDIVAERFDAGVRVGEQIQKDMIAVPIGPPTRMAVAAAPAYFARHPPPVTPQGLAAHNCINLRLPTHGGLYAWEFEREGTAMNLRVEGQLVFNSASQIVHAALGGFGVAMLPEDMLLADIAAGRLMRVLEDWCPPFPGYHLYYPTRRQLSPAFALVLEALRLR
jgi:DNA-binding transcriptional LysR family regulator